MFYRTTGVFSVEVQPKQATLPPWFDPDAYQNCLLSDPDYTADYDQFDEVGAAREKTFAFLTALNASLLPSVSIVINSSTGKDSTLLTSHYVAAMRKWRDQGRPLRSVLVQVSDTGGEFPEMALRMRAEVAALNRYGMTENLPLRARLVSPPPKHRLLVELIGNGKPLPRLAQGQSKNGYNAAAWCMDRLKARVLDKALKDARLWAQEKAASAELPAFVQCLGVRNAESAKRSATIKRYALADLPAVSRLGDDDDRLGFCPVVHWEDKTLRNWLVDAQRNPELECPWRPEGVEELVSIYQKGANESENPHECALVITKDGGVSNSCSDLTGTRMGCVFCAVSRNKSLANTASKDPRYIWLKKCHDLIYTNHARNQERVKLRNDSGFTAETLFPKSFTFEERYRLLVHIFRAEMESGFELLPREDLDMISTLWTKHGVYTVTVDEAREDARRWKLTGESCSATSNSRNLRMSSRGSWGKASPRARFSRQRKNWKG